MKISVCMPTVGPRTLLRRAIYSLLLQDHDDWELVLYDADANADDFRREPLSGLLDSKLQYAKGPNLGLFPGFDFCIRQSSGQIIYCMGSDDQLSAGSLSAVSEAFEAERYPTTFWLYGKTVSANSVGKKLGVDGDSTTYDKLLGHNRLGLPSVFWARGLMELAGGFDPRYKHAADYELWLRFWQRREPMFLNQELGIYCHHDGQASRVHASELEVEAQKVAERYRYFGKLISVTRNILRSKRAYPGGLPETMN